MNYFEKLIIPFIEGNLKKIDFTDVSGFVGCYTEDPDKPSAMKEFYLVYDDRKHNEYTIERCIRFDTFKSLKRVYIKYINSIPYRVYSFFVNKKASKFYDNVVYLEPKEKLDIIKFWGDIDNISYSVLSQSIFTPDSKLKMNCKDYVEDIDDTITIKAASLKKEIGSLYFFIFYSMYLK